MEPEQQPPIPKTFTIDEQVGKLTATIDQLQREFARTEFAVTFLLCAGAMLATLALIQHRQILKLAADA